MRKIVVCTPGVNWRQSWEVLNGFIETLRAKVQSQVEQAVEEGLEAEADGVVGRAAYARRDRRQRRQTQAYCQRCGTRYQRQFMRNGRRRRQVVTLWGVLTIWLPRVKCACGGSVRIEYALLGRYQRLWDDLTQQVQRWASYGLSLRQMQAELRVLIKTDIGLRTLNARLQAVKVEVIGTLASVPPIVLLDALWVTVLLPSGRCQTDRLGRRRPVKQRRQVPVLLALGVWPRSGQWQVLDWELADQEDQAAWERLLARLEARGLYAERGLRLLVHDGGSGLRAALRLIYPQVPHQRCVFHKLRNLWQAILMDEPLAPRQALAFKTRLIRQAAAIYRAPDEPAARALADRFAADWRAAQPDLVATLQRDFDDTLRFYALLARFPDWRPQSLRTTSLLERLNRTLRRIFRAASAYHSLAGLHRAIAHTLAPFFAP